VGRRDGQVDAHFLEGLNWPRERTWAFVCSESEREWDDVAFLLAERFEDDATPRAYKSGVSATSSRSRRGSAPFWDLVGG